jgi:SAM-dependent methyltransferase
VIWILVALIVLLVLDAGRMRGRLAALSVVPGSGEGTADGYVFITGPGVTLDAATRRDAAAFARAHDLDLVDLIPRDLPAVRAMGLVQMVDPEKFRRDRIATGRTAGHAVIVTTDVATRAQLAPDATGTLAMPDEVALLQLAGRLRHYAAAADLAVVGSTRAAPAPLSHRRAILTALFGPMAAVALLIQPVVWTVLALALVYEPIAGVIALGVWHLQPVVALVGTPVRSRDVWLVALLRAPIEVATFLATLVGTWKPPPPPDLVAARIPVYTALATQRDRFFNPRRETCPLCGAADLRVLHRVSDLLQHKPGTFTLERCAGCGHVFQNPQLSIAGLDYYYKDFYDGLGEAGMEMIFGFGSRAYHERARLVRKHAGADPPRWLDVGAGHGHFCAAARADLPATRFDGLDLSESVDEAHRRGWIDAKYRGLFPEVAPTIAGQYDAVSMSHYLEHTLDPRAELAAARTALVPGGHLMIEVPDPEFRLGRALGRLWLPYFQPQHLHLVSVGNLDTLLREHGFEPVEWHRGAAHQRVDLFFAVMLALGKLAPPRLPWRPWGIGAAVRRTVMWTLGMPVLLLATAADMALGVVLLRGKRGNTYRVVARRGA